MIIFYNPIMHEIEMFVLIVMWMCIFFNNSSMSSSTRMCYSKGICFFFIDFFRYFIRKIRDFSNRSDKFEITFIIANQ